MSGLIAYIAIVNNQDQPIYLKNLQINKEKNDNEIQMQLIVYSALELIDSMVQKKIAQMATNVISYVGFLSTMFLADNEYDIYGYHSPTRVRMILIMNQKVNLENYNESTIKQIFKGMYELYLQDLFNPFNPIKGKFSPMFEKKILKLVEQYQKSL